MKTLEENIPREHDSWPRYKPFKEKMLWVGQQANEEMIDEILTMISANMSIKNDQELWK